MSKQSAVQTKQASAPGFTRARSNLFERRNALGSHLCIQREAAGPAMHPAAPSLVRDVVKSPGQPLDSTTRAFMEPRFGYDLSLVRIHTDDRAAESARAVDADAYTVGPHVVFGMGQYTPGSPSGQRLMAHELTHVVQQASGPVASARFGPALTISDPQDVFEQRASDMAALVTSSQSAGGEMAPRRAPLPAGEAAPEAAVQRDAATTWGAIGAIAGIAALAVAAFAWLKPKNVNATAQGIQMQPNPFQFSTLGDNAASVPDSPEAQKKFQSAAEQPPQTDKILELQTDKDNDASFNLQYNTDGHNVISAEVVPGDTKGYQGGYNGSVASVVLSETQTFPPPKGAVQPAAQPAATGAGGASPAGGPAPSPAPQVARAVIHFSGTNGKSGHPLQTFGGEVLLTADGTVRCLRSEPLNGIGYGVEMGSYGFINYRTLARVRRE